MSSPQNPAPSAGAPAITLSSTPILTRALKLAALLTLALVIVGGVVGYLADGVVGGTSAVIGAAMAFVFLGITALSILIANRFYANPLFTVLFFAIVLGAWLVKFVLFITAGLLLRDQPWINKVFLFGFLIVGVVLTLVVDVVVVARTRMPYVSDSSIGAPGRSAVSSPAEFLPNVEKGGPEAPIRPNSGPGDSSQGPIT